MARTSTRKKSTGKVAKKATRKSTTRTTKKATTARRSTTKVKATPKQTSPITDAFTKSQILSHIAEEVGVSRKEVGAVFESLTNLVHRHMKKRSCGQITIPGLMKCMVKNKPATKARKGINPFTGEMTTFKAKPARNIVKVRPLKKLKEMAES